MGLVALLSFVACAAPSIGSYPEGARSVEEPEATDDGTPAVDGGAARPANPAADPKLTVTIAGDGIGTVTSTPAGLTCEGTACAGSFPSGAVVTLTPSPAAGSTFVAWGGACNGTAGCTVTLKGAAIVTAELTKLDGTWTGPYENIRPAHGCTFANKGTLSVALTTDATAISSSADIDGLEIRQIPGCTVVDSRAAKASAPVTSAGATLSGTWSFAVPGTSGTLAFPFTATVAGKTITGTWTCPSCTGSFTLTKP